MPGCIGYLYSGYNIGMGGCRKFLREDLEFIHLKKKIKKNYLWIYNKLLRRKNYNYNYTTEEGKSVKVSASYLYPQLRPEGVLYTFEKEHRSVNF